MNFLEISTPPGFQTCAAQCSRYVLRKIYPMEECVCKEIYQIANRRFQLNVIKNVQASLIHLLINDTVLSNGNVTYSEVTAFLHKDPYVTSRYMPIKTSFNEPLMLSESHTVFTRKGCSGGFNPM